MELRNAVDGEAADDGEVRHAHLAVVEDRHGFDLFGLVRIFLPDVQHETSVDLIDDLIDSGQQSLEQIDRPFLKRLGHDGMVRIRAGLLGDLPGFIPFQLFLIQQDAHQFCDRDCRMSIVHLDTYFFIELSDIRMVLFISLDRSLQGSGYEEILLFQTELLAGIMMVCRIEHLAHGLCQVRILAASLVVAHVKAFQIEIIHRLGIPQTQRVNDAVLVADHGHVIGDSQHGLIALLYITGASVLIGLIAGIAAEFDFLRMGASADLKGILIAVQPSVRNFLLIAVFDLLAEHAVFVADTTAVCMIAERRKGIQETCGETSEAAVAERPVSLLVLDRIVIHAELCKRFLHFLQSADIDDIIAERAAHQEFHGHVIDHLDILIRGSFSGIEPGIDDLLLQSGCRRSEDLCIGCFLDCRLGIHLHELRDSLLKFFLVKYKIIQ